MNSPLSYPSMLNGVVSTSPTNQNDTEMPFDVGGLVTSALDTAAGSAATSASTTAAPASGSPWYVALAQYSGLALLGVLLVIVGTYTLVKD